MSYQNIVAMAEIFEPQSLEADTAEHILWNSESCFSLIFEQSVASAADSK